MSVLDEQFVDTVSLGLGVRVHVPCNDPACDDSSPDSFDERVREAMFDGLDLGWSLITPASVVRDGTDAPFDAWLGTVPRRWALDGRAMPYNGDARGIYELKDLGTNLKKQAKNRSFNDLFFGRGEETPQIYVTRSEGFRAAEVVFGHNVDRGWTGELAPGVELFDTHPHGPWMVGVRVTTVTEPTEVLDLDRRKWTALRKAVAKSNAALGSSEAGYLRVLPLA